MNTHIFESQGFVIAESVLSCDQVALAEAGLDKIRIEAAGTRNLLSQSWCGELVRVLRAHPLISSLLPIQAVAVQCTLFEKSTDRNWLVPLHQDMSIPVREKVANPSLSGWSEKEGTLYVQPPIEVLEELVAVRVHVDDCGSNNGPLRVIPGSHREGRLPENAVRSLRAAQGEQSCTVARGGALIMKPLLLHASSKALVPNRRRILHFLFGPALLPLGLEWMQGSL